MSGKEVFLRYKSERDVVFFFGAGASYQDGVPLQKDLLCLILSGEDKKIATSSLVVDVAEFIKENFAIGGGYYPSLESVFGLIDYLSMHRESLGPNFPLSKIKEIRESLVKLIHYTIAQRSRPRESVYAKFWEKVRFLNRNISIVTTNYDSLLEDAFSLYPDAGYIDYCLHLMNYDQYERHHMCIHPFNWWINPREPVLVENNALPSPIKLIKLHGSLDWKYCNCCGQVLLTPWSCGIDLSCGGFLRFNYEEGAGFNFPEKKSELFTCPLDGTRFDTLILPPSYIKELTNPIIASLRLEASRELRCAKKIVFVGYSFPEADVHIRVLLKKNIPSTSHIMVIDPNLDETKRRAFSTLGTQVDFCDITFSEAIKNTEFVNALFGV
jgi:hypothetical protein